MLQLLSPLRACTVLVSKTVESTANLKVFFPFHHSPPPPHPVPPCPPPTQSHPMPAPHPHHTHILLLPLSFPLDPAKWRMSLQSMHTMHSARCSTTPCIIAALGCARKMRRRQPNHQPFLAVPPARPHNFACSIMLRTGGPFPCRGHPADDDHDRA